MIHLPPASPVRMLAAAVIAAASVVAAGADFDIEAPPINYLQTAPDDAVSRLQVRVDSGDATLGFEAHFGYLPAVLRELKIPVSSQTLVFSKTSLQASRISPQSPRAIYFNDDTYVGWVPGGHIEISTVDPRLGTNFYMLDQEPSDRPQFVRHDHECLQCHGSVMTGGVPGHVMRSVATGADGTPKLNGHAFLNDHTSPLHERWGGWYVTGEHGHQRHLGNVFTRHVDQPDNLESGANLGHLHDRFNTLLHLSGDSDIVALLVLGHQVTVHNALARAAIDVRVAEQRAAEHPGNPDAAVELAVAIRKEAEPVIAALLFANEARLTDPVIGSSVFRRKFEKLGPFDPQGRSLRQLDLQTRLLEHPCSYLVSSRAFQELPPSLKQEVEQQLWDALAPDATTGPAARLDRDERQAIREILLATVPVVPVAWQTSAAR